MFPDIFIDIDKGSRRLLFLFKMYRMLILMFLATISFGNLLKTKLTCEIKNFSFVAKEEVCRSQECHLEARRMLQLINQDANPCDDFYEFSCGKFHIAHNLKPSETSMSITSLINDDIVAKVQKEFAKPEIATYESNTIKFAKYLFDSCTKNTLDTEKKAHLDALLEFANGWNIGRDCEHCLDKFQLLTRAYEMGIEPIFTLDVVPNPKNHSQNIVLVSNF